jgi:hypothetical protein
LIELNSAVHIPGIGKSESRHALLLSFLYELSYFRKSLKEAVVRVGMEVDVAAGHYL